MHTLRSVFKEGIPVELRPAVYEAVTRAEPTVGAWFSSGGKGCLMSVAACALMEKRAVQNLRAVAAYSRHQEMHRRIADVLGIRTGEVQRCVFEWDNAPPAARTGFLSELREELARLKSEGPGDPPHVDIKKDLPLKARRVREVVVASVVLLATFF